MLSILIPVYNFDVRNLVRLLDQQCRESGIEFEIRCRDDGSTLLFKSKNQELLDTPSVIYKENEANMGRSAIRNKLAIEARYKYLLFLDSDSGINDRFHIQKYVDQINQEIVLCGGTIYTKKAPDQKELMLRWHYGTQREQKSVEQRNSKPYHSFTSNNFLIPKALFLKVLFDESIREYGHEDTLFGLELQANKIKIQHIDNPVVHLGLENNERFLVKSKTAIYNLSKIADRNPLLNTKLLKLFHRIQKLRLKYPVLIIYQIIYPLILKNLNSASPSLLLFDIFKIGELIKLNVEDK